MLTLKEIKLSMLTHFPQSCYNKVSQKILPKGLKIISFKQIKEVQYTDTDLIS